jgi:hypothetical protein
MNFRATSLLPVIAAGLQTVIFHLENHHARIYLNRFWFGIQGSGADTPWQALEMLFEAAQKKNHLRYLLGS